MKQSNVKEILVITAKLIVICSIVAAIIAFVNSITKDKIAYNEKLTSANALTEIYSSEFDNKPFEVIESGYVIKDGENILVECSEAEFSSISVSDDITALYVLNDKDGNSLGYCVATEPMGFKDKIKMLVAVNSDTTVKGVKIVSMSETKGYGTKAGESAFLDKFVNLGEEAASNVDIITGATKTSSPVINAVSDALKQVTAYTKSNGGAVNE